MDVTSLTHQPIPHVRMPNQVNADTDTGEKAVAKSWWISRLVCYLSIAIVGLVTDLLSKHWIFDWLGFPGDSDIWWLVEDYVGIQTAINPGALFGFGAGWGRVFAGFSVIAAIAITVWLFRFQAARSWWITVASGAILAGIFGNMYDRAGMWQEGWMPVEWSSGVRDWILLRYKSYTWPNFNIADSLLVCGAGTLAWRSFFYGEPNLPIGTSTEVSSNSTSTNED